MSIRLNKIISRNILPIIIGGALSILIHLGLLYLIVALFSEEELSDLVIFLIAFFIPAMVGGFIVGYFFAKSKFIHTILTAIIFMIGILIPEIIDFSLEFDYSKQVNTFFITVFIIIVLAAMLGGYIGIRMKRRRVIN
jgi:hypothetical protein